MSAKEKYIHSIRTARTHQVKWANQIKLMVSGVTLEKETVPVDQTDSEFSKWLYGEAMIFSMSNAKNIIDEMVDLHGRCYDIYLKIYGTLFAGQKNGILGIFGTKKASLNDLKLAQNYYEDLMKVSDQLLSRLRSFESIMLAQPESKFDELVVAPPAEEAARLSEASDGTKPKQKIYFRGRVIEE